MQSLTPLNAASARSTPQVSLRIKSRPAGNIYRLKGTLPLTELKHGAKRMLRERLQNAIGVTRGHNLRGGRHGCKHTMSAETNRQGQARMCWDTQDVISPFLRHPLTPLTVLLLARMSARPRAGTEQIAGKAWWRLYQTAVGFNVDLYRPSVVHSHLLQSSFPPERKLAPELGCQP